MKETESYTLDIPQYVTEVEVSKSRRKKYFTPGTELPIRYQTEDFKFVKGKLVNVHTKEPVVRNNQSAGKPRMLTISGNEIYARMHERMRMKIVQGIKDNFRPHLRQLPKPLPTPLVISCDLYAPPRYCEWDLDNLWIYNKCLQDLLRDEGYIPDDTIQYITGSAGMRYYPVETEGERKMKFTFRPDTREIVMVHNMFRSKVSLPVITDTWEQAIFLCTERKSRIVISDNTIDPGRLVITPVSFHLGVGKKKVLYGAAKKAIKHLYSKCMQLNISPVIPMDVYSDFQKFFDEELVERFIQIYIVNDSSGSAVYSGAQHAPNEVPVQKD